MSLLDFFFGCWHKRYSFPITVKPGERRNAAAMLTGTYIVCLDCGREFAYDWKSMKVVSRLAKASRPMGEAAESYVTKAA